MKKLYKSTSGFTIIELLIATMVFSVVLLTISSAIIQIGRLYYKSITSSRTQAAARTIMTDISDAIQFNDGEVVGTTDPFALARTPDNGSRGVCVAGRHYSYRLRQQRSDQTNLHAVVAQKTNGECNALQAQNMNLASLNGSELLGDKMRLDRLVVEQIPGDASSYKVSVRVVYGDNDLLCDPDVTAISSPAHCSAEQGMTEMQVMNSTAIRLNCKNVRSGTQFCAASELSTIVKRRLIDD